MILSANALGFSGLAAFGRDHTIKPTRAKPPDNSNSTRIVRRNPISLTFRNATMPSTEPANSAGRLTAKDFSHVEVQMQGG
jgi:hypothetical protein